MKGFPVSVLVTVTLVLNASVHFLWCIKYIITVGFFPVSQHLLAYYLQRGVDGVSNEIFRT